MTRTATRGLASRLTQANQRLMVEGDVSAIVEFFSPRYLAHVTGREVRGGHLAVRKIVNLYHRAFADLKVQIEILVTEGDRVAWQRTIRAKHVGPFRGFPPSGRRLAWRDMITSRFDRSGLIAEEWFITDLAEQLLRARKR